MFCCPTPLPYQIPVRLMSCWVSACYACWFHARNVIEYLWLAQCLLFGTIEDTPNIIRTGCILFYFFVSFFFVYNNLLNFNLLNWFLKTSSKLFYLGSLLWILKSSPILNSFHSWKLNYHWWFCWCPHISYGTIYHSLLSHSQSYLSKMFGNLQEVQSASMQ